MPSSEQTDTARLSVHCDRNGSAHSAKDSGSVLTGSAARSVSRAMIMVGIIENNVLTGDGTLGCHGSNLTQGTPISGLPVMPITRGSLVEMNAGLQEARAPSALKAYDRPAIDTADGSGVSSNPE